MALRIVVGVCIFGAGWYAVDQWKPGLLPRIDVASKIAALRGSPATATLVLEEECGKDSPDTGTQASGQSGTVNAVEDALSDKDTRDTTVKNSASGGQHDSVTRGRTARSSYREAGPSSQGDGTAERTWERIQSLLIKKVIDRLVPSDLQVLLRDVIKYVRRLEQSVSDFGYNNARLLLLCCCAAVALCCCCAILFFVVARWFSASGAQRNKNETEISPPASPPQASAIGWKSNFSISKIAGASRPVYRCEGGYFYQIGEAADQLKREGTAAAVIQRWARTVFQPWLREHVLSRSNIDTLTSNSQHWIDVDHGAVSSTILDDSSVNFDDMGPMKREPVSNERTLEEKSKGGDDASSRRGIRCRKSFSLSSASISRSLLRLKPHADQRPVMSPVSEPP